jgi:hypothetical protein
MAYDPLSEIEDAPLFIVPRVLDRLYAVRERPRLGQMPGIDALTDRLLAGIEVHPTKFWVMKQFQQTLKAVAKEDTEACQHIRMELEELLDILGVDGADGVLSYYLSGI